MDKNKGELIKILQNKAKEFITQNKLIINQLIIEPKEIEIYYHKKGEFEDNSVHQNELQQSNPNHFYIHRVGKKYTDTYKGGNYGGIDYVISNEKDVYYSYLIRSALVNGTLETGPNRVLKAIIALSNLEKEKLEKLYIEKIPTPGQKDIIYTKRINLGKTVFDEYLNYNLRLVICDQHYRKSKYPMKESMLIQFLQDKISTHEITKEKAIEYAKEKLGYIPSKIRLL